VSGESAARGSFTVAAPENTESVRVYTVGCGGKMDRGLPES
jgi:hypothetical protein